MHKNHQKRPLRSFLEASLVRQADGELKNDDCLSAKLFQNMTFSEFVDRNLIKLDGVNRTH